MKHDTRLPNSRQRTENLSPLRSNPSNNPAMRNSPHAGDDGTEDSAGQDPHFPVNDLNDAEDHGGETRSETRTRLRGKSERSRMTTRGRSPVTSTMNRSRSASTKSNLKKANAVAGAPGGAEKKKIKFDESDKDNDEVSSVAETKPKIISSNTDAGNESLQLVLLGEKPRGLYECDYCRADLTRSPRVRCAVCPDFDLCLDCLATSDHVEMCKSRREFQRMHRRNNEEQSQVVEKADGKKKKVKNTSKRGAKPNELESQQEVDEEDDPSVLGYMYNNQWIPYFRHEAYHGYVVADSTRYMLFPPFRGVTTLDAEGQRGVDLEGDGCSKVTKEVVQGHGHGDTLRSVGDNDEQAAAVGNGVEAMEVDPGEKVEDGVVSHDSGRHASKQGNVLELKESQATSKSAIKSEPSNEVEAEDYAKNDEVIAEPSCKLGEETVRVTKSCTESPIKSNEETQPLDKMDNDQETTTPKHGIKRKVSEVLPKKHEFRLVDDLRNIWTIEEDLRLLDGILTCGLGNWPDIAEHVNGGNCDALVGGVGTSIGGKTDKMCMERYLDDFLGRYGRILPPYTMVPIEGEEEKDGKSLTDAVEGVSGASLMSERKRLRRSFPCAEDESAPGFKKTRFRVVPTEEFEGSISLWPHPYIPPITGIKIGDEVGRDLWYRSEQSFVRQCSSAASKLDVDAIIKDFKEKRAQNIEGYEANVLPPRIEDIKSYPGSELAGYMPRRGDFDVEHDNDAENLIADMEFSTEDSKADQDLKVEVIKIFNSKLDEREKRKQFVFDKKLLNYRENQEKFQKLPADERHIIQCMRLFERFHSIEKHQAFLDDILKAKRLRKEIAKLQTYRRLGIKSLADAEKYELDKSRREYHKMAWLKKEAEKKKAEADAARAAKENASDIGVNGLEGGIGTAANQSLEFWKQYKTQDSPKKNSKMSGDIDDVMRCGVAPQESSGVKINEPAPESDGKTEGFAPDIDDFLLTDKPGYCLLSSKERDLCKRLRLLPQHYLDVKKALISESLAAGMWDQSSRAQKGKSFVTIDVKKTNDVIDFILKSGWISTRPIVSPAVKEEGGAL
ncbi:hypothetical protein HJC23_003203 [Cyclotella cryptica]|uniref:Transcriptional adapter n=1 Tax=Cyclotella cryptica TaxID=29204 RepID=A0ABD3PE55_9STRA|eukprot:CCRYP_015458-RA/>CCRYP_015458-RA protein AED:0.22 eAED:0.22 QI:0/-1/0/1/-1/1/1/0/1066